MLILHQSNQWRDYNYRAAQEQRGKMKAKRFTGARWQDSDGVAPGEYSLDELALARTKMLDAEPLNPLRPQRSLFENDAAG
jgi:hypothetical protein